LPRYDILIVGAGTAGIPCAIEAAKQGARVLLVDKAARVGGTLHVSGGHMTGAGTRRQRERGIEDHPDRHYDDVMRIGRNMANPEILRRAVDLAPGLIDWLDEHGFRHAETSPRLVYGHEPYSVARTHYGNDEARSILAVLRPLLDAAVAAGTVELWLDAPVRRLCCDCGRVTGAIADRAGETVHITAAATVLATGGYGASPALFGEIEGSPLFTVAPDTATGDGLLMAREVGGAIAGTRCFLPTFGGLPAGRDTPGRTLWTERAHLVAAERPPWEIYVDRHGARFVAEDDLSIDAKERALLARVPDLTFHVVLDARAAREAKPLLVGTSRGIAEMAAAGREGFAAANTLEELAERAGIDAAGLCATVNAYNAALVTGAADPFGRLHRPAPIAESPFYAVRNHGATLITFAGVAVGPDFAVRSSDESAIAGLYAIGEVLGCAATMGNAFCGGMTLTPALAFGRDLGKRLGTTARLP
jgi:succinate dehydrogenase/fumarate reductase flavoprotein subunit